MSTPIKHLGLGLNLRTILIVYSVIFGFAFGFDSQAATTNLSPFIRTPAQVKLRPLPDVRLEPQQELTKEEIDRIKVHIRNLAKIDSPDFGMSATMSGSAFAPIAGMNETGALLLTNHQLKTSGDLVELVKFGPKALPYLLEALDDTTPTKLIVGQERFIDGMWFDRELWGNPANAREQKAITSVPPNGRASDGNKIESYTIKIGDICFVIIGQIVGRPYEAVRYQPTACIVVNSPTHDAVYAKQIRDIWTSTNSTKLLFDSLILDYSSDGIYNGISFDGWGIGSDFQKEAALRLLYYFPRELKKTIAERLSHLDVRGCGFSTNYNDAAQMTAFIRRELANGVRTEEFIKAVAWSKEPVIREEITKIYFRTDDPEIRLASSTAIDRSHPEPFRRKMEELIATIPPSEMGPFGDGYNLLVELGRQFGADAKPAFLRYMKNASLQRCRSMCHVLEETRGEWSIEILSPLLEDKRPAKGWTYSVVPNQNEPRLPIRICDEAAATIAHNFPKLKYQMAGEHKDLDVQIEAMRERIARKEY